MQEVTDKQTQVGMQSWRDTGKAYNDLRQEAQGLRCGGRRDTYETRVRSAQGRRDGQTDTSEA